MQTPTRRSTIHPGIRIDQIPADGAAGFFFAIASMAIFLIGVPETRPILLCAIPAGGVVALLLHIFRKSS